MIVSGASRVYELYSQPGACASKRGGKAEDKRDVVALSVQAKDYQAVRGALSKVPDVREDLVRGIAERIANGTYNVSASEVAEKIFSQGL